MNKLLGTCLLCAWAWGQQANAQESIKVGDTTRNMITYAPEGLPYNPPLVISLHGLNQDANYQKGQANWEAVADTASSWWSIPMESTRLGTYPAIRI